MKDRRITFALIPNSLSAKQVSDLLEVAQYYRSQGMKVVTPMDETDDVNTNPVHGTKDIFFTGDLQTACHFANSLGLKMIPVICKAVEDDNFIMSPNPRRFNHFSVYQQHKIKS